MLSAFTQTVLDEVTPAVPADGGSTDKTLSARAVRLRDLRQRCQYRTAATVLPSLIVDGHQQVNAGSRAALPTLVQVCFDASFVARGIGDLPTATLAADRGARAARLYGDPVLMAGAGFAQAHAALRGAASDRARLIAESYLRELVGSGPSTAATRGMLHLTAAFAIARTDAPAWERVVAHLATAATLNHPAAGRDEPFDLSFGPRNIAQWTLAAALDAGQDDAAIRVAATLHPRQVTRPSRRCAIYIDLANLDVRIGRPGHAVHMLLNAYQTAPEYYTSRLRSHGLAALLLQTRMPTRSRAQLIRLCRTVTTAPTRSYG